MRMSDLSKKLVHADRAYAFYPENKKTLVGFSGGADSMALLHALTRYLGRENIAAVHINHMLRGADADADEAFCEQYCRENGIEFYVRRVDVNAICGGKGFEEAARNVRYDVFETIAREAGCATVSLAHTADDNLETIIFHLCRGAGAAGLSGIPPKRPLHELTIVRPLIDCTREDILAYLAENGLSHRTDATNDDITYTRNFIRGRIVPLMREINPEVSRAARNTSAAITALSAHIEREAEALLDDSARQYPLVLLREMDDALLYAVVNRLYQNAGGKALPAENAKKLIAYLKEGKRGGRFALPHGILAEVRGDQLRFISAAEENPAFVEEIPLALGENRVSDRIFVYVGVSCQRQNASYVKTAHIPLSSLPTLMIRPRKEGERYRFGGMTRTLKKLLCGAESAKKSRPVICDENGILWHPDFPVRDENTDKDTIEIHYIEIV